MWTWISDWFWSKSAKTTLWLWPDIWCQLLVFTSQRYSRNQKHIEVWQLVRIIYELWAVHLFLFFSFVLTGVWEAGGRQTKHCFTRTIRELFCIFYPVNHLDKSVLFFFVELIQKKAENKKIQDEFNYYDWLLVLLWKYNNTSVHRVCLRRDILGGKKYSRQLPADCSLTSLILDITLQEWVLLEKSKDSYLDITFDTDKPRKTANVSYRRPKNDLKKSAITNTCH